MTPRQLYDELVAQGCDPKNFQIEGLGGISDVYCLADRGGGRWEVYYSERGIESPPEFVSRDRSEAYEHFRTKILSIPHFHCVGFFHDEDAADGLSKQLDSAGVGIRRDVIPYASSTDLRHRIFVSGADVFEARHILGNDLPIRDIAKPVPAARDVPGAPRLRP